jgi:DNA polymerase I
LQRYKVLFISGKYFRILSYLNRNIIELDVRRAFTVYQITTIQEENHYSLLIVEHDPQLFGECREENSGVPGPSALRQISREATILLCAPALDPHREKMAEPDDPGVRLDSFQPHITHPCNYTRLPPS